MVSRYLISTFLLIGLVIGCTGSKSSSIPSPDGSMILITDVNTDKTDPTTYLCVKFQITDDKGNILYEEQTSASDRMKWTMEWEGNNRVVLKSSDIGTYVWERGSDGTWQRIP